jgi:uncharacterized protein DUF4149
MGLVRLMIAPLFVYLLCLTCWLGGMVFFTIFTAPAVFATLTIGEAGKVVGAIFPRYYLLGYIAGIIGLILAIYFAFSYEPKLWWSLAAIGLAVALGLTFYAGGVIRPRIEVIRPVAGQPNPDASREAEFKQLHRLSVTLNGGVMLINLLVLLSSAAALATHV